MTSPDIAIQRAIITILRADTDNFSTINGYAIGEPFLPPPVSRYPFCKVSITDDSEDPQDTGYLWRRYNGNIVFMSQTQDIFTFDVNDTYEVTAYSTVSAYLQAAIELLSSKSNRTLAALTFDNGGIVQEFLIGAGNEYGIVDRDNSYDWQAATAFTVLTKEPRDYT